MVQQWLCAGSKMLSATWNLLKVTIKLAKIYEKDNISNQSVSKRKISWKKQVLIEWNPIFSAMHTLFGLYLEVLKEKLLIL